MCNCAPLRIFYTLAFNGDFKQRVFYSLGGGIQKNQLYGTEGTPRAGVSYYAIRPGKGKVHGTKLNFNFAKGVQEPTIDDQFGSLYSFLLVNGGASTIQQFGISPIGAEQSRSYDGGIEQNMFSEHLQLRMTYFHNEFGRQIEYVGANLVPQLLPQLSPAQQQALQSFLQAEGAYALTDKGREVLLMVEASRTSTAANGTTLTIAEVPVLLLIPVQQGMSASDTTNS